MDDEPRRKTPAHTVGQDLSSLSLEEIEARIVMLGAEIERLKVEKERKQAVKGAADALFKLP